MRHTLITLVGLAALATPLAGVCQPKGTTLWPAIDGPAGGVADGQRDAALIIAIEDYAHAPNIPGARKNGEDWYTYLRKVRGVPLESIKLLRNEEAAREDIEDALASAVSTVKPGGTFWLIFIGHGAQAPRSGDALLLGADARKTARSIARRSVTRRAVLTAVSRGRQARGVVLLDSCFSGKSSSGADLAPGIQPALAAKRPAVFPNLMVVTAARGDQFAGALPKGTRPAFSYLMLGALRGWADADRNGQVTVAEAFGYVKRTLRVLVTDRLQTPELHGAVPGAVLAAGTRERGPSLDDIRLGRRATISRVAVAPPPTVQPVAIAPVRVAPAPVAQKTTTKREKPVVRATPVRKVAEPTRRSATAQVHLKRARTAARKNQWATVWSAANAGLASGSRPFEKALRALKRRAGRQLAAAPIRRGDASLARAKPNYRRALAAYRTALMFEPTNRAARAGKKKAEAGLKAEKPPRTGGQPASKLDQAKALEARAKAAKYAGNMGSASKLYAQCLKVHSGMSSCRTGLIPILMARGKPCSALRHIRRHLKARPGGSKAPMYRRLLEMYEPQCQ